METIFPDEPGASGALLLGWRRRPGSAAGPGSIESVVTVVVKRAYDVSPSTGDPTDGSLTARADGPEVFPSDHPGDLLVNGDFADGLTGWTTTGGVEAVVGDGSVTVTRAGADGDLRQDTDLGRSARERGFGLAVKAQAATGLALPAPSVVAGGVTVVTGTPEDGSTTFPAAGAQPVLLTGQGDGPDTLTTEVVSLRLPALGIDGRPVTYSDLALTTIEYESDLVADKPEGDVIVIVDQPPAPMSVTVNGSLRLDQAGAPPATLTGLGWEPRFGSTREGDGGSFDPPPAQPLPDGFDNRYYNGYRRDRRLGASLPHLAGGDEILITRSGGGRYGFTVPADELRATHAWYVGSGVDDPCLWRTRTVPLRLDTLVVEPDRDHAYAVWRATWSVDDPLGGLGPVPLTDNRRITVTAGGA